MQDRFWYVLSLSRCVPQLGGESGLIDIRSAGTLLHVFSLQRAVDAHDRQVS